MLVKKGFSLIEVLIVIVLISILSSAGYLFWQNQSGPTPTSTPSKTIEPTTSAPDSTSNWNTYADDSFGISFKYPNNLSPTKRNKLPSGRDDIRIDIDTVSVTYQDQGQLLSQGYDNSYELQTTSNTFTIDGTHYQSKNYRWGEGSETSGGFQNHEVIILDNNTFVVIVSGSSYSVDNGITTTTESSESDLNLARQIVESTILR